MAAGTHTVEEERELAARLAGVLFLTAGVTALGMLLLPGVEHGHRDWVIGLAAVCVAWGLFCVDDRPAGAPRRLVLARARHRLPRSSSAALPRPQAAPTRRGACTSSSWSSTRPTSTAATTAFPTCSACMPVALTPLLYDGHAVEEGYIGEVIVVCLAYVILGLLIIRARSCSWSCASARRRWRCSIP